MFRKILTSALFAGFVAGLIAAVLQLVFVQPVLLYAELYESGALVHFGIPASGGEKALPAVRGRGVVRDGLGILFTALVHVGYGLILVASMSLAARRGAEVDARTGLIWGVAGWVAVQLAPAFGLPPELPGSSAADIGARQLWWFGTVAVSAAAMWLIAFGGDWPGRGLAVLLLLAPHVIGAPEPVAFAGPAPPELAGQFAARALGVGLAAWAVLGSLAGHFWARGNA